MLNNDDFSEIMFKKTDEELIKIVTTDKDLYLPLSVEAADNEIKKRGIDLLKIEAQRILKKNQVSSFIRFLNYFIDVIMIIFIISILGYYFKIFHNGHLTTSGFFSLFISYFFYYVIMEYSFQRTVGKFMTKTKVVTSEGERPEFYEIVVRTVCRFIPYDCYSFLYTDKGFHDYSSGTRVISSNN
jgi:uncharacterized RDD family membrane protein YckC